MNRWKALCPGMHETPLSLRITNLTNYLKSIQKNSKIAMGGVSRSGAMSVSVRPHEHPHPSKRSLGGHPSALHFPRRCGPTRRLIAIVLTNCLFVLLVGLFSIGKQVLRVLPFCCVDPLSMDMGHLYLYAPWA
jgi:hypothetical protein